MRKVWSGEKEEGVACNRGCKTEAQGGEEGGGCRAGAGKEVSGWAGLPMPSATGGHWDL